VIFLSQEVFWCSEFGVFALLSVFGTAECVMCMLTKFFCNSWCCIACNWNILSS